MRDFMRILPATAELMAILALAGLMSAQTPAGTAAHAGAPEMLQTHQTPTDRVLQQHLDLAEKARQRSDTKEELRHLRPAFDRAIRLRSVELIEYVAGMIELAYQNTEQMDKGLEAMKRADAKIRSIAGAESVQAAEFESEVAMTYVEMGRPGDAQALMTEVARKLRKAAGPDSLLLQNVLEEQAMLAEMSGKEKQSSDVMKEAEAIEERRHHKSDFGFPPDASITRLLDQARAALEKKELVQVDRLVAEATAAAERLDVHNPQRAVVWWEAAMVYDNAPVRPELVARHLLKSLDLSESALGKEQIADVSRVTLPMVHLLQVGTALYRLPRLCGQLGAFLDCGAVYERGLADFERALGPNHPAVGSLLGELSSFLSFSAGQDRLTRRNAGAASDQPDARFEKALSCVRRQLTIYEQAFGKDDPLVADTVERMAEIYDWMGDLEAARPLHDRAMNMGQTPRVFQSEEDEVIYEVRHLRLLLSFDEADARAELYLTQHPGSTLKLE